MFLLIIELIIFIGAGPAIYLITVKNNTNARKFLTISKKDGVDDAGFILFFVLSCVPIFGIVAVLIIIVLCPMLLSWVNSNKTPKDEE